MLELSHVKKKIHFPPKNFAHHLDTWEKFNKNLDKPSAILLELRHVKIKKKKSSFPPNMWKSKKKFKNFIFPHNNWAGFFSQDVMVAFGHLNGKKILIWGPAQHAGHDLKFF